MTIQPDDPRLTTYALGELEPDEAAQLESALRAPENAPARQVVEEIRQTASLLERELAAEPAVGLTDAQRQRVEAGPSARPDVLNSPTIFTMRRVWLGTGLAAAACVAVAIVLPALLEVGGIGEPVATVLESGDEAAPGSALESIETLEDVQLADLALGESKEEAAMAETDAFATGPTAAPDDAAADPNMENLAAAERQSGALILPSEPSVTGRVGEVRLPSSTPAPVGGRGRPDARAAPDASAPPPPPAPSGVASGEAPQGGAAGGGAERTVTAPGGGLAAAAGGSDGLGRSGGTRGGTADDERARAGAARRAEQELRLQAERELRQREEYRRDAPVMDEGRGWADADGEDFAIIRENPFVAAAEKPLSTFSIDVDTASYSNVRRILGEGRLPRPDVVRIEELINYFPYDYAPPAAGSDEPFAVHVEITGAPWQPEHRLVKVGLKGREVDVDMRPATSLVFLVDTSGSMRALNKLPLVKQGLQLLVNRLNTDDRVAIVAYAGKAGLVLPSTYVYERETILEAIDRLEGGGSTNGSQGIGLAYDVAAQHFIGGGVNRVILCTDGDFNVGISDDDALVRLAEDKRRSGVFLSVFGYGSGNLKDAKMEKISNAGNGTYGYIDSIDEARRVFVDGLAGTLVTIAKDVKVQVDFNPGKVAAYRLIGYENRMLEAREFDDDTKDAGEIGAGHTVTALYEIIPAGAEVELPASPQSDFVEAGQLVESDLLLNVRLRYKQPDGETSVLRTHPVADAGRAYDDASADMRFAAAVAAFGMVLRDSTHRGAATYDLVDELARDALAADEREQARRYLEDFIHYAGIAKPDLARANAEALLGLELDAETMQRIVAGLDGDELQLAEALALAKQVDGLRDVGQRLGAELDAAAELGAAARVAQRPADAGLKYRAEFVDLVERAREISGR